VLSIDEFITLQQAQTLVQHTIESNVVQEKEKGEAQQAIQARGTVLNQLDDWMVEFKQVAQIVLADQLRDAAQDAVGDQAKGGNGCALKRVGQQAEWEFPMFNTISVEKATLYDKYRLPYAAEMVDGLLNYIGAVQVVADIGAGTGQLARLFAHRVAKVYAVEPDPAMRKVGVATLAGFPNVEFLAH
jgi:hypothetical protein